MATHLLTAATCRALRRIRACRRPWRRALVVVVGLGVVWAVISVALDPETAQRNHSSENSRVSRSVQHLQEEMTIELNKTGSSYDVTETSNEELSLLQSGNFTNSRYNNIILGQLELPKSRSRDTVLRQNKWGIGLKINANPVVLNRKELAEAEQDFALRRKQVRETCSKYGLGKYKSYSQKLSPTLRYPPTANYDVLYINRRDGFTYCPVYKVASTSWLHYLCQLAGADPHFLNSTSLQIATIARKLWPQLDYDEASMLVPTTLKFMLVRHPFERIVSAYRDKLENINVGREHGVLHFYESYGKKIVRKYRQENATIKRVHLDENSNLPGPSGVEPTFQEFVRYLIDTDLVHYADDHWMPYYLYCTPCFIEYDVIANFDSLERDQKYIFHKLNLSKDLKQPHWKHLTKGKKTSAIVEKYLNTLSKVEKHRLYEKYKIDFEMFSFQV